MAQCSVFEMVMYNSSAVGVPSLIFSALVNRIRDGRFLTNRSCYELREKPIYFLDIMATLGELPTDL